MYVLHINQSYIAFNFLTTFHETLSFCPVFSSFSLYKKTTNKQKTPGQSLSSLLPLPIYKTCSWIWGGCSGPRLPVHRCFALKKRLSIDIVVGTKWCMVPIIVTTFQESIFHQTYEKLNLIVRFSFPWLLEELNFHLFIGHSSFLFSSVSCLLLFFAYFF